ncbi:cytochrome c oxidase assembly protein subunit 15 [Microbacterium phyllosphaerae]|uniref:Cytochrome c oxidase assembly protein subunit 15 n=1 Tax=Microbacterium phyllosphaerae TaxID=124798 RepID=A0ABS4WSV8_9MICO|nr:COX15/CtaA family protein [Microbacterium phyllosphaerae]MBP2379043.1 cytochrome c oxidase assembly protein subunit 15 [Microbacterium phyllosphaerae]
MPHPSIASPTNAPAAPSTHAALWGRALRISAWLSFLAQTIIIGTGGAVRLTGSGLGCSEWPLCTPESLVPIYADQGIHGLIEFGNRVMTGVVGIIALAVLLLVLARVGGRGLVFSALRFAASGIVAAGIVFGLVSLFSLPATPFAMGALLVTVIAAMVRSVRLSSERRDLVVLAWIVLVGVVAQALVGGITVLTGLNPFIVGFHYVSSLLLVCVTAAFLVRLYAAVGPRVSAVPTWFAILSHVTGLALAVTILFGVLTTGSGPHSGDADVFRHGFDATILAHVHSWPGYILAALVAALTISAWALRLEPRKWLLVLVLAIVVQVGVGIWQAREGLPPLLVGIHMVLASLSAATYTVVVLHLKKPVAAQD